ncbi:interleukin-15-like isoform X2 [Scyliorhinus canicula]|uniref:interleukin-15-like isoform X2 n=1 Tax=Scyliorhinus canicula TaxID=7830 RepID=UPI0018F5819C|nr:interleukin-15-like isoform X2 [Scyliorhinus canicula]
MNPLFCIFALTLTTLSLMQSALFIQFFEDVTSEVDNGNPVDVLYLDFRKVFDKMPHRRLIHKRRQEKRVCFYCYLHLSLDCHIFTFINTETGISLLLLCNLALCLPKAGATASDGSGTVAVLREMFLTVKSMQELPLNAHKGVPELRLYTPDIVPHHCFETAINCFVEELKVLNREFSFDSYKFKNQEKLNRNAKVFSKFIRPENCTICEEFQEKNVKDFLNAFARLLQQRYPSAL